MRKVIPCLAALAALTGCGAEEQAPAPDSRPVYLCPRPKEAAPEAFALLSERQVPHIAAFLRVGITDMEARATVDATLRLMRALSPTDMEVVVELLNDPIRAERAQLFITRALRFILEGSDLSPGYQSVLLEETQRLLTVCDGGPLFDASLELLSSPEMSRLKVHLAAATDDFEIDLEGLSLTRETLYSKHISLLLRNLVFGLSHPNFDFRQHIREPLEGVPFFNLDRPDIQEVLDDLEALLAPERGLIGPLTDLACCASYGVPTCAEVRAQPDIEPVQGQPTFSLLAYEAFIWPVLSGEVDLGPSLELLNDPRVSALAEPLQITLEQIAGDETLRAGFAGIIKKLVDPMTTAGLIEDMLKLLDNTVMGQILDLLWTMADGCEGGR